MARISSVMSINILIFTALAVTGTIQCAYADSAESKAQEPDEVIGRLKVQYKAEGLSDPFRAVIGKVGLQDETVTSRVEKEIKIPDFVVQGVIWGPRLNQAIINNKVLKKGDTIEGAEVLAIDKSGIILLFEGKQINLSAPAEGGA
jgi:hypothetical protein